MVGAFRLRKKVIPRAPYTPQMSLNIEARSPVIRLSA